MDQYMEDGKIWRKKAKKWNREKQTELLFKILPLFSDAADAQKKSSEF